MEHIHVSSAFRFGHEVTEGMRIVPPTEDELTEIVDPESGETVKVPNEKWERKLEEVQLDTVVFVDLSNQADTNVFKFAFDKDGLAELLTQFVPHLDPEGRKKVRDALEESSGLVIPRIEAGKLKLVE